MAPTILGNPLILTDAEIISEKIVRCNDELRFDQSGKSTGNDSGNSIKSKPKVWNNFR